MNEKEALDVIVGCGALLHGHFVGTQEVPDFPGIKGYGLHMPVYLDGRVLVTHPTVIELLARSIAQLLAPYGAEVVVGMPIGAYTLGHEVAKILGVRFVMAEKVDGGVVVDRPAFRSVVSGKRVVLIEDTVNDGTSLLKGVAGVAACGGELVAVGANFDRGRVAHDHFGVPYLPLIRQTMQALTLDECQAFGQCAKEVPINRTPGHGKDLEVLVQSAQVEGTFRFA